MGHMVSICQYVLPENHPQIVRSYYGDLAPFSYWMRQAAEAAAAELEPLPGESFLAYLRRMRQGRQLPTESTECLSPLPQS